MSRFHCFAVFAATLFVITSVSAQEDVLRPKGKQGGTEASEYYYREKQILFGVETGVGLHFFSVDMIWNPVIPNSPLKALEKGSGASPYIGLFADVSFNDKIGGIFKLNFSGYQTRNIETGYGDCEETTGIVRLAELETDYTITGSFFSLDALLRYNFTPEFLMTFGPFISIPVGDFESEAKLTIMDDYCYFIDTGEKVYQNTAKISEIKSVIGLSLGAAYKLKINDVLSIAPTVEFRLGLSNLFDDDQTLDISRSSTIGISEVNTYDAKFHTLRLGVLLWFDFNNM